MPARGKLPINTHKQNINTYKRPLYTSNTQKDIYKQPIYSRIRSHAVSSGQATTVSSGQATTTPSSSATAQVRRAAYTVCCMLCAVCCYAVCLQRLLHSSSVSASSASYRIDLKTVRALRRDMQGGAGKLRSVLPILCIVAVSQAILVRTHHIIYFIHPLYTQVYTPYIHRIHL